MLLQAGAMLLCLSLRHRTAYYRYRSSNEPLVKEAVGGVSMYNHREPPAALIETPTGTIARDISVNREARDVEEFYRTLLDPKVRAATHYCTVP